MKVEVEILSRADLERRAEAEAQEMLGVSAREAFQLLDDGKLRGTLTEVEFICLRELLNASE